MLHNCDLYEVSRLMMLHFVCLAPHDDHSECNQRWPCINEPILQNFHSQEEEIGKAALFSYVLMKVADLSRFQQLKRPLKLI